MQSFLLDFCSESNSVNFGKATDNILFLKEIFIKYGKNRLYLDIALGNTNDSNISFLNTASIIIFFSFFFLLLSSLSESFVSIK